MIRKIARPAMLEIVSIGSEDTMTPTAVVTRRPRNIQKKDWVRNACASRASGRTPSWLGAYVCCVIARLSPSCRRGSVPPRG